MDSKGTWLRRLSSSSSHYLIYWKYTGSFWNKATSIFRSLNEGLHCRWYLYERAPGPLHEFRTASDECAGPGKEASSTVGDTYITVLQESTHTPLLVQFLYRVKVYLNEHPPWSKLHMANQSALMECREVQRWALCISETSKKTSCYTLPKGSFAL